MTYYKLAGQPEWTITESVATFKCKIGVPRALSHGSLDFSCPQVLL